jgi:hypothetical protein
MVVIKRGDSIYEIFTYSGDTPRTVINVYKDRVFQRAVTILANEYRN